MAVPKIAEFDAEEKPAVSANAPARKTAASPLFGLPIVGERIAIILFGGLSAVVLSFLMGLLVNISTASIPSWHYYRANAVFSLYLYLLPIILVWGIASRRFARFSGNEERVSYFAFGLIGYWLLRAIGEFGSFGFFDRFLEGALVLLVLLSSLGFVVWWLVTNRSAPVAARVSGGVSVDVPLWKTIFQSVGGFLSAAVLFIILVVIFVALAFADVFRGLEDIVFPFVMACALLYTGELLLAWRLRARGLAGLFWGVVVGVIVSALLTAALIFLFYNFSMNSVISM